MENTQQPLHLVSNPIAQFVAVHDDRDEDRGGHVTRYPSRHSKKAGGFDLYADLIGSTGIKPAMFGDVEMKTYIILKPGQRALIGTGVALEIHEDRHPLLAFITPRSGLAHKKGVTVLNSPGLIDADYTGELKVNLINLGQQDVVIRHGDRIAQVSLIPTANPHLVSGWSVEYTEDSQRGANGHGSTGEN